MELGSIVELQKQSVKVVSCESCQALMVNIDAAQVQPGDLVALKRLNLRLSNPATKDPICLKCDIAQKPSFRNKVHDYFERPAQNSEDDDSHLFSPGSSASIFGDGFGGFGGGVFSGGGASGGF